jgi:hypothetical protein
VRRNRKAYWIKHKEGFGKNEKISRGIHNIGVKTASVKSDNKQKKRLNQ